MEHTPDGRDTGVPNGMPAREDARFEQIHLRLPKEDAAFLRKLAADRHQTLSGAVRHLLGAVRRSTSRTG